MIALRWRWGACFGRLFFERWYDPDPGGWFCFVPWLGVRVKLGGWHYTVTW